MVKSLHEITNEGAKAGLTRFNSSLHDSSHLLPFYTLLFNLAVLRSPLFVPCVSTG